MRLSIFAYLVQQDQKRKQAQEKLECLLQEGLDSDSEPVTPTYWQNLLRIGVGCRFSRKQMNDLTPLQLRQKGLAALVQALGAVGMVRFMQQFEAGSGDYTRDSEALLR